MYRFAPQEKPPDYPPKKRTWSNDMSVFYERGRGPVRFPRYTTPKVNVPKPRKFPANVNRPPEPKQPQKTSGRTSTVKKPERIKSNALQIGSTTFQRLVGRASGALGAVLAWEGDKPDQTIPDEQFGEMMSQFSNPLIRNDIGAPLNVVGPTSSAGYNSSAVKAENVFRDAEVVRLPELYVSELPIRIDRSRLGVTLVDAPAMGPVEFSGDESGPIVASPSEAVWVGSPHKQLTQIIIESVPQIDIGSIDVERIEIRFDKKLDVKGDEVFQPTEIIIPKRNPKELTKTTWEEIQLEIPRNGRPRIRTKQQLSPKRARSNDKQRSDKKSRVGQLYLGIKKFVDKTIGGDLVEFYFILTDNLISEPQTKYRPPYKQGFISYWDKSVNRWRYKAKTPKAAIEGFNNGFLHLDAEGLARDIIENAIEDRVIGEFSRRATKGHKQMLKQFGREGREIGIQFGPTL